MTAPRDGPSDVAMPPMPAQVAMALARRPGATPESTTATADGVMSDHPMACTARPAISIGGPVARVHTRPAAANTESPVSSMRLRP